jgi:hypothetical protein
MGRLFESVKTQLVVTTTAGAAGQTAITSSAIDTAGYDGLRLLVLIGAITTAGVQSIKLQYSDDDAATDAYSDVLGSSVTIADDADNTHIYIDVYRPLKRYVKAVITRATQDSTFGGVIAELYNASKLPVTQTATGETHIAPIEGTA